MNLLRALINLAAPGSLIVVFNSAPAYRGIGFIQHGYAKLARGPKTSSAYFTQ